MLNSRRHSTLISIPLTLCFHWDSVPNPDTPCGLCVLHVFAVANTRTRPVVWWRLVNFQGGTSGPTGFPSPLGCPARQLRPGIWRCLPWGIPLAKHPELSGLLTQLGTMSMKDDGGRRAWSAHVNLGTSAGYMTTSFGPATLSGNVLTMTATSTGQLGQNGKFYPFRSTQNITGIRQ